ncbi:hypothetical protein E2C01_089069 [Portunus trituberculatus]|uniref:Uncharacterized protein n=1 Tax=Portunus trituberculatus TaxID=210409 RepID=A0A5B7JCJ3_PORTR|nr:hypothetical protein [Portunus trituberculatus]
MDALLRPSHHHHEAGGRTHLVNRERPVTPKLTCRGIDPGHDNLQKQQQQLSPAAAATTTSTAHTPVHPAGPRRRGEGEEGAPIKIRPRPQPSPLTRSSSPEFRDTTLPQLHLAVLTQGL